MCKCCGHSTCCGGCWSALLACLRRLCCCCYGSDFYVPQPLKALHSPEPSDDTSSISSRSSIDMTELAVTRDGMLHPDYGDDIKHALKAPYNCWCWSISPLTHSLKWEDPPDIDQVSDVHTLAQKVTSYLTTNFGCAIAQYNKDNILPVLANLQRNKFVIAMRVGSPAKLSGVRHPISYHFARYIFGQWSYKDGGPGRLIMASSDEPTLEPDSFWKEHDDLTYTRNRIRRFPRNPDGTVRDDHFVYNSETIYLVVTFQSS